MISEHFRSRLANIEKIVKDDCIPFLLLREILTQFIIDAGYNRTPYQINIPFILRARAKKFKNHKEACNYFDHLDKFSYPDVKKVPIGWGRCNGPHEAVFYCAGENVIPIFEVRPNEGDYLVLSQYRHIKDESIQLTLPIIGIEQIVHSLNDRDPSNSLLRILAGDMYFKETALPEILSIDRHFANWFIQAVDNLDTHYYKLTTALYQAFTKNTKSVGSNRQLIGLIYPSVGSDISGINIALETKFVDENLKLLQAVLYKVEKSDHTLKSFSLQPLSDLARIGQDGYLTWKQSEISDQRLTFDPSTPTLHHNPPVGYFTTVSVYE